MFYLYIYIIAWLTMSSAGRHSEKFYVNKTVGPVHTPFAYKNKNFEIIIPKRVNAYSDHITFAMKHHYVDSPQNEDQIEEPEDQLHLIIPIEGRNQHVELRPTRSIMSPGMLIETFKHSRKSRVQHPDARKNRQCHFTGRIRGKRQSKAALSTCNGLSGYIQTGEGLFMIEPKYEKDHSVDKPHPHVLYAPDKELFCATDSKKTDFWAKRKRKSKRDQHLTDAVTELYIETLVVLDHSLLGYHKDIDVENYVLTVFNIAHNLFHDSTLGVNINLAIVRLIRLEVEDHEMNIAMNHNIEKSMRYFRRWQKRINPREDSHPNHHDMAVLLTRIDICGNDKTCGFVGAARFAGMCDAENEAVIAQDSGLLVGYTIAHEIGHTLGLIHDEKAFEIDLEDPHHLNDEVRSTVMSPHISDSVVEWSNCSQQRLKLFIDYGFGSCLFDAPTEHSFVMADELPGVMYDGDHQCREMFGPNGALCMTGVECDNLICYVEDKGCIETHTRPAEGTSCGENKWCFHGECVELGERPGAVHGNWSDWSEWSECTRTCGSGVASQMRYCNKPAPKFDGRFCDGENVRYKICITEPCDPDAPSFRDVQCLEFNTWLYPGDGRVHQWKSYPIHDENPCALYCVNEEGNIASLRQRVIDGTTCYRGIRDICINGLCKEIPCDLDLQSSSVEDRCGVCKGDGTSCDVVRGERTMDCVGMVEAEKQIMTIPAGAVNVKIEEILPSETRIQVRDKNGSSIYIDGDMLGNYNVHGSTAWVGMIRNKQEAISIQGPLNETISIWANVQMNSTLRYTYGVKATKKRTPFFSWDYVDWTSCSTECGPGLSISIAKCVERTSGLVDESYCKSMPRLKDQSRPCDLAPCTPRWFVGEWGDCQECTVGASSRNRIVKCYRPVGTGEGELHFIADSFCANNKPKASEYCACKREKRDKVSSSRLPPEIPISTIPHEVPTSTMPPAVPTSTIPPVVPTSTIPPAVSPQAVSQFTQFTPNIYETTTSETTISETTTSETTTSENTTKQNFTEGSTETQAVTLSATLTVFTTEETDEFGMTVTQTVTNPSTASTPKIKTIVDLVNLKHTKLTIHTELESNNYPKGLPHPKGTNDTRYDLYGRDALKFMNTLQHNFANNKTKV